MEKLIQLIIKRIESTSSKQIRIKLSRIKLELGNKSYLKSNTIDQFNEKLSKKRIKCEPELKTGMSDDQNFKFSIEPKRGVSSSIKKVGNRQIKPLPKIFAPEDFFKHLFDFESDNGYDNFQACLDSKSPMALFVIPKSESRFYSSVISKVLSYELIRKRQYKLDISDYNFEPLVQPTTRLEFNNIQNVDLAQNLEGFDSGSDIFEFSTETMESIILAKSGEDLIESEKFEKQFNELAILANRYINKQFFVVFNCPPTYKLNNSDQKRLNRLISKISETFPFVYKLESKHATEKDIPDSDKNEIVQHFKLLNELPCEVDSFKNITIPSIFSFLQKSQIHFENQIFHNITAEEFEKISFGYESDEHIYLKYFAIKSLQKIGYDIEQINCEERIKKISLDFESTQVADVSVKGEIIVEIETLRGKTKDKDVYFALAYNILKKSKCWDELKELWLTIPGFEVARNYYQLQKTQELLQVILSKKLKNIKVKICCPDYKNCELVEIDFSKIKKRNVSSDIKNIVSSLSANKNIRINNNAYGLDDVIGLDDEKKKLTELKQIIDAMHNLGINGILLHGLPGCGKTYLAKCFAQFLGWSFSSFSPAEIVGVYIGETQKNIRAIFNQVRHNSPSILFIDEIDSIGFSRNTLDGVHTDQKAAVNQLLIELNKLNEDEEKVIVIGATNNLKSLDSALKRSGRFDYKIHVLPPTVADREKMFDFYLNKNLVDLNLKTQDLELIASITKYFTSSDIKSVCNSLRIKKILGEINNNHLDVLFSLIEEYVSTEQITLSLEKREEFILENQKSIDPRIKALIKEWTT